MICPARFTVVALTNCEDIGVKSEGFGFGRQSMTKKDIDFSVVFKMF